MASTATATSSADAAPAAPPMALDSEQPFVPPEVNPERARKCFLEFLLMCITLGVNHATATAPIQFAKAVLGDAAGNASNAVLYGTTLIMSLFFSNVLFSALGAKYGLSLAMFLYAVYVALFALSSSLVGDARTVAAIAGAAVGGCGAGILWTCQGAFYAHISQELATAEAKPKEAVTSRLSGIFAAIFLGAECIARASTTLLTSEDFKIKLDYSRLFYIMSFIGLASALAFQLLATKMESAQRNGRIDICAKVMVAVRLWSDPKIWLLQSTNLAFGFAASWNAAYVNGIVEEALGVSYIGFHAALLSLVAGLLSYVFGPMASRCGKGPVLLIGVLAFLCLGILGRWVVTPHWGYGVLVLALCMGTARAVYESTNKAIFADFFPGSLSAGAFANAFVFGTGSSTMAFVFDLLKWQDVSLMLLLLFASLTFPFFLAASLLAKREQKEQS